MRLGHLDLIALINQMWGSEENLHSHLASEVPRLCSRICGPDAPVPEFKVFYPKFNGRVGDGNVTKVSSPQLHYRAASDEAPARILISAFIAGHKSKLPHFLSYALISHWEALGATGENPLFDSDCLANLLKQSGSTIPLDEVMETYSPLFLAKAKQVARELEVPLYEFLFPTVKLSVYLPESDGGNGDSTS